MNQIKRCLWIGALLLPAACNSPTVTQGQGAVSDTEVRTLSLPEPGAGAADYTRRAVTLRLFGTQAVGQPGASATVAEKATWSTRTVRQGGTLGRNWLVAAVKEDGVELRYGAQELWLPVGGDVQAELIEHAFDRTVIDQGQHVHTVQPAQLALLHQRYGLGASAEQVTAGELGPALRLSAVAPGSALSRLGFQEGDLIYAIDDVQAQQADLAQAVARMESSTPYVVRVRMAHGHSMWEAAFVSQ